MAIAILGMGLMGAGLAEAALGRGETVTVWNRTREKAEALGKLGARVADSPGDAVAGASRVHLFLHADAAVDTVLGDILAAVEADTVVIDHSTTSPERTADRAEMLDTAGIAFLHVPVFMSPANCRADQLTINTTFQCNPAVLPALRDGRSKMRFALGDQTETLEVTVGVVPLFYPKFIDATIGYVNPALSTQ